MFVEINRGRSFRGLAQYCLHDVDAQTSDRVAFVETRNLATTDPQAAWRVMAAKHYMQDELKRRAGIGKGGRKDGKPVGHLLIGWRNDEAEAQQLDRAQMVAAASGALRAIDAHHHEAMIVAHTDTEHPHCHVIINLVGDDGRLKKNWKERLKLSKFALEQEIKHHGEPICKQRLQNHQDRQAGETPEPVKKKARHLYELDKAAANDDVVRKFAEQHVAELKSFACEREGQTKRHQHEQVELREQLSARTRRLWQNTERTIRESRTAIRKETSQKRAELLNQQEADRREFEANETSLKGSVGNAMSMIDWDRVLGKNTDDRSQGLSYAFEILTSEGHRRQQIQEQQKAEREKLRAEQRAAEQRKHDRLKEKELQRIRDLRSGYVRNAATLRKRQDEERTRLQSRQQDLKKQRDLVLQKYREEQQLQKQERAAQSKAERDFQQPCQSSGRSTPAKEQTGRSRTRRERKPRKPRKPRQRTTQAKDLAIQGRATGTEAAANIDKAQQEFEQRMREQLRDQWDKSRKADRER